MATFGSTSPEVRERIKVLRLLRRWDQAELATRASTSTTTISLIETGRMAPTREQVAAIAAAFGYSPSFLFSELSLAPTTSPWLRAYADASKREADARTAGVTIAVEYIRRLDLPLIADLIPHFAGHADDDDAIEEAAAEVRALAGIGGDAVVGNAIRAAERLGCVVLPLESELGRHLGMSVRSDHVPVLCVARGGIPGDRQRFTVAHELGHLTLHQRTPPPRDSDEASRLERQANRFAIAFLGPGDPLIDTLREVGGRVTLTALAHVKATWGIAIKALVGRFHSLGVIDADHARSLYKQISARKWTKAEPVFVPTESAQWFERAILRKSRAGDLESGARVLAAAVGGNSTDLMGFADWRARPDATVISLADRRHSR